MRPSILKWLYILVLVLAANSLTAREYKGAEYRSLESFLYGRFEVRYQAPAGNGMLASFFTYHEIESLSDWNEIDFEILGRYDHDIQVTTIGPARATRNSHQWVPFNPHDDFHDYAFEWTPDYIAWFVDGIEIYRQTGSHIKEFKHPQKIMMNIWPPNAENWTGIWDESILPVFALYDHVSYASYTPDSGSTGTGKNFTPVWRDDLNDWDQGRWQKATHTFDGNNCDFIPENAVFEDGKLILCLTTADQTGYVDLRPPKVLYAHARIEKITLYFSEPLEKISAENTSSYSISGIKIHSVRLHNDARTVDLTVSALEPANTYSLAILGVMDNSPNQNKLLGQIVRVKTSEPLSFPVKINMGPGNPAGFLPDQVWQPSGEYGFQDGYDEAYVFEIGGTDLDSIYQTARRELVGYKIRVPEGSYKLTFMMAENDENVTDNPRLFNITVEDTQVADSINIYEQAGLHQAFDIASPEIEVSDGQLDIHFSNLTNYSLLCGLTVEQLATSLDETKINPPVGFELDQNFPNPFNGMTTIIFYLPQAGQVSLNIFDITGRQIESLDKGYKFAGKYRMNWQPDMASGVYFYQLQLRTDEIDYRATRKMLLIK